MENTRVSTSLKLTLIVGTDDEGKTIRKDKSIFKFKPYAKDEDLYNIGMKASELLKHDLLSVGRVNKEDLVD